jgi:hypothetical protein
MAGGLVAKTSRATISDCYATGTVTGKGSVVGGLIGFDYQYTVISNSYASGAVTGENIIGGLLGKGRHSTISNCYARGSVSGNNAIGGLVGFIDGCTISNSYSVGTVSGATQTGAFIGYSHYYDGSFNSTFIKCFWDSMVNPSLDGIGNTTDSNVIERSTLEMQQENTFTDAGWDFTTPVWKICETVDYPRLAWQKILAPILNPEPDITTDSENTITWRQVNEVVEYYAVCCNDPNLEEPIMDSGWLDTNKVTFAGLDIGRTYYYAVKARNCVIESDFSNVESSMQVTLGDAIDLMLDPNSLKNANMANALTNKIDEVLAIIDAGNYQAALKKLENDILKKTDGCANSGEPDKNDWIETCQQQGQIYPLIMETIEYIETLLE